MKLLVLLLAMFMPAHVAPNMIPNNKRIELPPPSDMRSYQDDESNYLEPEDDPPIIEGVDAGSGDDGDDVDEFSRGIMITWVAFVFFLAIALLAYMSRDKD